MRKRVDSSKLRRLGILLLMPAAILFANRSASAAAPSDVKFAGTALVDALDYFRDATEVNFAIDWKAIEAAGISRDTPVSLRLSHVTVRTALRKTLDAAAPGVLTFYVDGNVVHITTLEVADTRLVTRVYPVGDLLVDIPDFEGPDLSLQSSSGGSRSGGSAGGSSSSGGNLFNNAAAASVRNGRTLKERADALVELIQSTVRPEVWSVNGGKATMRYLNGTLVVTAPQSVQDLID